MGHIKDLHITIYNGGDEAVAAVDRIGKDWREQLERAASEIESLRLTDAEREAIAHAADLLIGSRPGATLRGLLARVRY